MKWHSEEVAQIAIVKKRQDKKEARQKGNTERVRSRNVQFQREAWRDKKASPEAKHKVLDNYSAKARSRECFKAIIALTGVHRAKGLAPT